MDILTSDTAVLFPGQGVAVGDAGGFAREALPELTARASELVGEDPFERASESTRFAQPAIFLASLAGWTTLEGQPPLALAGHSLGELSALAAAGALSHEDALSLVVLRGQLMADAADASDDDGGMLALLKGTPEDASEIAESAGVWIANDNAAGQTVLSGPCASLRDAAQAARDRGLRAMTLDVAGAFHSPAMADAEAPFLAALRALRFRDAAVPVFSSMTAAPFLDVALELSRALTRPVRWRETMLALQRFGAERYVDAGPDGVLARLVARNIPGAAVASVEEARGVPA